MIPECATPPIPSAGRSPQDGTKAQTCLPSLRHRTSRPQRQPRLFVDSIDALHLLHALIILHPAGRLLPAHFVHKRLQLVPVRAPVIRSAFSSSGHLITPHWTPRVLFLVRRLACSLFCHGNIMVQMRHHGVVEEDDGLVRLDEDRRQLPHARQRVPDPLALHVRVDFALHHVPLRGLEE